MQFRSLPGALAGYLEHQSLILCELQFPPRGNKGNGIPQRGYKVQTGSLLCEKTVEMYAFCPCCFFSVSS